jgi:general secretion pathway protein J
VIRSHSIHELCVDGLVGDSRAAQRYANQSGFTLVEVVIAFALLALLTTMLFAGFRYATRASDTGIARNELHEDMRRSQDFLRQHVEEMLPLRYQKELGKPLRFRGESSRIVYIAPVISRIAEGGVLWWELALQGEGDKRKLALRRAPFTGDESEPPAFEPQNESTLAQGVQTIKISYYDQPDPQLNGNWTDNWSDDQRLPNLIKIELKGPRDRVWPELVVQPLLTPSIGCPAQWDAINRRCITSATVRQ